MGPTYGKFDYTGTKRYLEKQNRLDVLQNYRTQGDAKMKHNISKTAFTKYQYQLQ